MIINRKKFIMKKYGLLFIILMLYSCAFLKSDVIPIDSIEQAQDYLIHATTETFVVFDIDNTLIVPAEKMFYPLFGFGHIVDNYDESSIAFAGEIRKTLGKFAASKDDRAIFSKIKFVPVEQTINPTTVDLVKALQSRNIKVIALTATGEATKFFIKDPTDLAIYSKGRLTHLSQIGLNFGDSFEIQEMVLDSLPLTIGFSPLFYKGALFSAGYPKGTTLSAFLDKIDWKPTQILFFDDSLEYCESVSSEMGKKNIPCHCFWYRAATKEKIKLDQKLIETQFAYWIEHKEILPEAEALKLISKK
jgi:FMN phosphatase YigB (HAD superfamily)